MADSRPREVIGVLAPDFRFMDRQVSLVVPLQLDRSRVWLGNFSYTGIARLRPGVTLAKANADMARVIPLMPEKFTAPKGMSARAFREARLTPNLQALQQDVVGDVGSVLWVLMGTIGMVLLIACANVANLLLVRAEGRQQELAVRAALGARWTDLVRELMTESLILGLAGKEGKPDRAGGRAASGVNASKTKRWRQFSRWPYLETGIPDPFISPASSTSQIRTRPSMAC